MTDLKTLLACLVTFSSLATADTLPTAKPAPTDPKLAQFVGRWEGSSELTVGGKKMTWKVTASCERAAVGPAILCMNVGVSGDQKLEEVWMLAYDQHSDTYHLFMNNNWGEAYDHAATWKDPSSVSFIHTGTRDGKPLREDYTVSFKGDQMISRGSLKVGDKTIGEGITTSKRVK